jgi:hypothetical protein
MIKGEMVFSLCFSESAGAKRINRKNISRIIAVVIRLRVAIVSRAAIKKMLTYLEADLKSIDMKSQNERTIHSITRS